MKTRIFSLMLVITLTVSLCAVGSFTAFSASEVRFILRADKSEAKAGETVNYSVSLSACEHVQALQVSLEFPDGLIYLKGEAESGISKTLDAARAEYSDVGRVFASFGSGDYSSDRETPLFSFSCKVSDTAESGKTYTVSVSELIAVAPGDVEILSQWDTSDGAVTVPGSSGGSGGSASSPGVGDSGSSSGSASSGGAGSSDGADDAATSSADGGTAVGTSSDGADTPAEKQTDENGKVIDPQSSDGGGAVLTIGASTADEAQGGGMIWLFVVIGIAAVLAAAVVIYFFVRKKKKEKEKS
ncbi:MAG: hypothetical protein IJH32_04330 [Ruminococcus sp.]|nr:hypothetical protein [Ruminococcus sp.]